MYISSLMYKNKILLFVSFTIFLVLVFLFGTSEIILRMIDPKVTARCWELFHITEPDSLLGYRLKPNIEYNFSYKNEFDMLIKTNSLGYRGNNFKLKKGNNIKRILCVGNSFTFGTGVNVEESWPYYLEKNFNNTNIEVYNCGVPSYTTRTELLWFEKIGVKFQPDLVILEFSSFNDLYENPEPVKKYSWYSKTYKKSLVLKGENKIKSIGLRNKIPFYEYLREESYLLNYVLGIIDSRLYQSYKPEKYGVNKTQEYPEVYINPDSDKIQRLIDISKDLISDFNQVATKYKIPMILLYAPSKYIMLNTDISENSKIDIDAFQNKFIDYCINQNIDYVNPTSFLRLKHKNNIPVYYKHDAHWTPQGNKVISEALFNHIIENELIYFNTN